VDDFSLKRVFTDEGGLDREFLELSFSLPYPSFCCFTILPQEGSTFYKVEMNCGIIYLMLMHRRAGSVRTYASGEGTALGEGGSSHLYRWERRSHRASVR
jgi:hypothetical protein